jgi:hypothetical protein
MRLLLEMSGRQASLCPHTGNGTADCLQRQFMRLLDGPRWGRDDLVVLTPASVAGRGLTFASELVPTNLTQIRRDESRDLQDQHVAIASSGMTDHGTKFTPTCVGKILPSTSGLSTPSIHPQMRGEDDCTFRDVATKSGSPPCEWGDRYADLYLKDCFKTHE